MNATGALFWVCYVYSLVKLLFISTIVGRLRFITQLGIKTFHLGFVQIELV